MYCQEGGYTVISKEVYEAIKEARGEETILRATQSRADDAIHSGQNQRFANRLSAGKQGRLAKKNIITKI